MLTRISRLVRTLTSAAIVVAFSSLMLHAQESNPEKVVHPGNTKTEKVKPQQKVTPIVKPQQKVVRAREPKQKTNPAAMKPLPKATVHPAPKQQTQVKPRQVPPKNVKSPQKPVQPVRVTGLKIGVKPTSYTGHCPHTFDFHCTITVNHLPASVDYEWLRSDGATGGTMHLNMQHTSVQVSDTWQLGEGKQHLREWEQVHIISPKDMKSAKAIINVNCR